MQGQRIRCQATTDNRILQPAAAALEVQHSAPGCVDAAAPAAVAALQLWHALGRGGGVPLLLWCCSCGQTHHEPFGQSLHVVLPSENLPGGHTAAAHETQHKQARLEGKHPL